MRRTVALTWASTMVGRMSNSTSSAEIRPRRPVPRGIAADGPAVLSYGFRPFFLLAGIFAPIALVVWIGALAGYWPVGGRNGPIDWHAHEMLFGYAAAALAGFVLTAVPNWTGKLPVAGRPLLGLATLWLVGRLANGFPELVGEGVGALLDCLFLPVLAGVVIREVVTGKNWKNLRVAAGISALAALNIAFHVAGLAGWDAMPVLRLTVVLFTLMITLIGGRIVPSFTRNYLAKAGATRFPRPAGRLDEAVLLATLVAGLAWGVLPQGPVTAALAALAAALQAVRLAGWRGWATWREPLLGVLHVGYAFVPVGLAAIALSALGVMAEPSALHLITVGAIGLMTLAVMTRATRGHTGRALTASPTTTLSYCCLLAAAVLRPFAEAVPAGYSVLLDASGVAFILAFVLFVVEYAPMLLGRSRAGDNRSQRAKHQA